MISHIWTVLCSRVIIDKETNNASVIDIVEQYNIPGEIEFPINVGNPLELVSLWSRSNLEEPVKGRGRITIISSTGDEQPSTEFEIDLSKFRRARIKSSHLGLTINGPGVIIFRVELLDDGTGESKGVVSETPLEIRIAKTN